MAYRMRKPAPIRGYELRICSVAERVDDLWRASKDDLQGESIERAALMRAGDRWRLYIGYVDVADQRWQIGLLESGSIDGFDPRDVRTVLHPDDVGMSAVKDPWFRHAGDEWLMFVSCGRAVSDPVFHKTGDALSTGAVRSETGLATSHDGLSWKWEGIVLAPSNAGWDRSTARLTAAERADGGWLGYYDGAASLAENYEERCGIARSSDLRAWERVSRGGPEVGTRTGPGGVRYVDITEQGDIFWEHTLSDGSHELRGIVAGR